MDAGTPNQIGENDAITSCFPVREFGTCRIVNNLDTGVTNGYQPQSAARAGR